jgi:hypothetical protein
MSFSVIPAQAGNPVFLRFSGLPPEFTPAKAEAEVSVQKCLHGTELSGWAWHLLLRSEGSGDELFYKILAFSGFLYTPCSIYSLQKPSHLINMYKLFIRN